MAELEVKPHLRKPQQLAQAFAGGRGNDPSPDIMARLQQSAARADRRKQSMRCITAANCGQVCRGTTTMCSCSTLQESPNGRLPSARFLQVVRNKSLLFADAKASYGTAQLGTLRLSVTDAMSDELAADYAAMAEMFMEEPPSFEELVSRLAEIEGRINVAG